MIKNKFYKNIILFTLFILTSLSYNTKAQGVDVVFWLDNSGSIDNTEWVAMSNTTKTLIDEILGCNSNNRIAVVHYAATSPLPDHAKIYIESDFSNNATAVKSFVRRTNDIGIYDYASESLELIGNALDNVTNNNILSTQKTLNKSSTNKLVVFYFTDATRAMDGSYIIKFFGLPPLGVYNQFKTDRQAKFVCLYAGPYSPNHAPETIAAIASIGGSYTGAVEANAGDPEGSGTTPRMAVISPTFTISNSDIQTITNNICSIAPPCQAGNTAPTIGGNKIANICPIATGDLTTLVTSTAPSGTTITYHTGFPATDANKISNPTTASTGTYYAAYWDATNNCYSPVSEPIYIAKCITNTCPTTTVDLTTYGTGTPPSGTTLQWHNTSNVYALNSSTLINTPNAVSNGTYHATYYDATNNCYSPLSTPIIVAISNCFSACYKPAITSGTVLDTKLGITALGRAGANNGNWPMVRKGAWIALEAKTKGFVVNRLTAAQIAAIPTANCVEGMMVYDTTNNCLKIYTTTDNGGTYSWQCFNTQTCP